MNTYQDSSYLSRTLPVGLPREQLIAESSSRDTLCVLDLRQVILKKHGTRFQRCPPISLSEMSLDFQGYAPPGFQNPMVDPEYSLSLPNAAPHVQSRGGWLVQALVRPFIHTARSHEVQRSGSRGPDDVQHPGASC